MCACQCDSLIYYCKEPNNSTRKLKTSYADSSECWAIKRQPIEQKKCSKDENVKGDEWTYENIEKRLD